MNNIKIDIQDNSNTQLLKLTEMLTLKWPYGTIFQEYKHNEPQNTYWITLGNGYADLIHIWYNDENHQYELSVDDLQSLSEFYDYIKCKVIEAKINFSMEII